MSPDPKVYLPELLVSLAEEGRWAEVDALLSATPAELSAALGEESSQSDSSRED